MNTPHVTVIGGGLTGLVAAHRLITGPVPVRVTVIEESPRLGGEVRSVTTGGQVVELGLDPREDPAGPLPPGGLSSPSGADPTPVALMERLGVGHDLVMEARPRRHVLLRGALHRVPDGSIEGVPLHLRPVAGSGLISPAGLARAGLDRLRTDDWPGVDESVGDLVTRRLGREFATNLVEPVIGTTFGSGIWELSAAAATPRLAAAARRNRSLIAGLRAEEGRGTTEPPRTQGTLRRGLRSLVDRLVDSLADQNLRTGTKVRSIESRGGREGSHRVVLEGGEEFTTDGIVIALPAPRAAQLVAPRCPDAARTLSAIDYAPIATAVLALDPASLRGTGISPAGGVHDHPRSGDPMSGSPTTDIALPFSEGRLSSRIQLRANDGRSSPTVVRIVAGHLGDDRCTQLDDDELIDALGHELSTVLGFEGRVREWHVNRRHWEFPRMAPGHRGRLGRILAEVRSNMPGVELASLTFEGTGLSAQLRTGTGAAGSLLDRLPRP